MQNRIEKILHEVAEEENLTYDIVKQIYLSTFAAVAKALREFRNVRIIGLGSFTISWETLSRVNKVTKRFAQDERTKASRDRVGWKAPENLFDE